MQTLFHQFVAGLTAGGIYASIALAIVMVHQSTHQLNFAQGEMAMFSTFIAWSLMQAGLPFPLAFLITVVISFAMGMAIERVFIRQLGDRSHLSMVVVVIGLLLVFNSSAGWIWGYDVRPFPSPFPENKRVLWGYVTAHEAGSFCITMVLLIALYLFFRYTSLGLAMRAAAQNPLSSRLVGVRVNLLFGIGWGLAAAIGAIAGITVAHVLFLDVNMMAGVILYGFAAALVGGIDNPWGAIAGGFLIGVVENLLGTYVIGNDLKLTFALLIIVGVLTFMPTGMFGSRLVRRV